jgi:hypothetical protein
VVLRWWLDNITMREAEIVRVEHSRKKAARKAGAQGLREMEVRLEVVRHDSMGRNVVKQETRGFSNSPSSMSSKSCQLGSVLLRGVAETINAPGEPDKLKPSRHSEQRRRDHTRRHTASKKALLRMLRVMLVPMAGAAHSDLRQFAVAWVLSCAVRGDRVDE